MITVMVNGCFDVLHYGHLLHLREAANMGDRLIVALTEDAWVRKGPGRPINHWEHRAEMLREFRCVDQVFRTIGSVSALREYRPDIFVKGVDYAAGDRWTEGVESVCREVGAKLAFTSTPKMSATDIIRKALT